MPPRLGMAPPLPSARRARGARVARWAECPAPSAGPAGFVRVAAAPWPPPPRRVVAWGMVAEAAHAAAAVDANAAAAECGRGQVAQRSGPRGGGPFRRRQHGAGPQPKTG